MSYVLTVPLRLLWSLNCECLSYRWQCSRRHQQSTDGVVASLSTALLLSRFTHHSVCVTAWAVKKETFLFSKKLNHTCACNTAWLKTSLFTQVADIQHILAISLFHSQTSGRQVTKQDVCCAHSKKQLFQKLSQMFPSQWLWSSPINFEVTNQSVNDVSFW